MSARRPPADAIDAGTGNEIWRFENRCGFHVHPLVADGWSTSALRPPVSNSSRGHGGGAPGGRRAELGTTIAEPDPGGSARLRGASNWFWTRSAGLRWPDLGGLPGHRVYVLDAQTLEKNR